MSRVLDTKTKNNCVAWRAPDLNVSEEDAFDYRLAEQQHITNREQTSKIRQQAYEKSYAKGYMEGLSKGQEEIGKHVTYMQTIMASLTMPLPDLDNQVVDEIMQLCIAMVKQMVRRELKMSPDEVVAVVKEAMKILPSTAADVTLELHPDDAMLIRKSLMSANAQSSWNIVEDPVLTRGGCRVSTSSSRVDATVETRLNTVISEMIGNERKRDE